MRLPITAALTAALIGLGAGAPAHASGNSTDTVQLTVSTDDPLFGADNSLVYNVHVNNAGPTTASGVSVRAEAWYCPGITWSAGLCRPQADPNNPSMPLTETTALDPLRPGQTTSLPFTSYVPGDAAGGNSLTTFEVVAVDQLDTASVPGSCDHGYNPQPACVVATASGS